MSRGRLHVVAGPDRHGVVIHALRLAAALPALARLTVRLSADRAGETPPGLATAWPAGSAVLLHVTDRLLGPDPETAAGLIESLASRYRLALSLHDIPDPGEGGDWFARRRSAYARLAAGADHLVVASDVERSRLLSLMDPLAARAAADRVTVIPLPVERDAAAAGPVGPASAAASSAESELAVLGFLHPGKGVEDVLDAAVRVRSGGVPVRVTSYGPVSEGHADLVDALATRARQHGVPFTVSGYLTENRLRHVLATADVPIAPHRHVSASGSVNSWIAAGRRPIVRRSGYAAELAERMPGTVTLADDLTQAVRTALRDRTSTWIDSAAVLEPSWEQAAQAHLQVLEGLP